MHVCASFLIWQPAQSGLANRSGSVCVCVHARLIPDMATCPDQSAAGQQELQCVCVCVGSFLIWRPAQSSLASRSGSACVCLFSDMATCPEQSGQQE